VNDLSKTSFHDVIIAINTIIKILPWTLKMISPAIAVILIQTLFITFKDDQLVKM